MRASTTPILLVSPMDSSIGYETMLRRNGFHDIHRCPDGISALQYIETNPVEVIISEIEMSDIDGFELTNNLREIEKTECRFSYVILISHNGTHNKIESSWQSQADVIIPSDVVPFRLIPQIMAGERVSRQMNRLLSHNTELSRRCDQLEAGQLIDPLTGLGNRRQAERGMEDTIRQIEARGGIISVLLVQLLDLIDITMKHDEKITDELIISVADKIKRLVRPLDTVTYFGNGQFAVIMQHASIEDCTAESYQRIYEGLALRQYQTRAGFLSPSIAVGACGAGAETGPPKITTLIETATENLKLSHATRSIRVSALHHMHSDNDNNRPAELSSHASL
ncbi:MAG: diguanylate cyclase [Pseudomonadales bacterium]|nr:diguanylate cyclase [Pseudomonadales bacterium]